MTEITFLEIPVYRCSQDQHTSEMNLKRKIILEKYKRLPDEKITDNEILYLFEKDSWYSWKYNEIIGYVNLYLFGSKLRVEFWKIDKKRINKGIAKKKFIFTRRILEASFPPNSNSNIIEKFIEKKLTEIAQDENFKEYYLNLEIFQKLKKFIDWKGLIAELKLNNI